MNPQPRIVLVAAVARDGGIGLEGQLLWRERADAQHFAALTMGHPVVMGRKTWESLPARVRPLPGRRNVVISRQPDYRAEGAEVVGSFEAALALLQGSAQIGVIGGQAIYAAALPLAQRLELTEIDAELVADTFFPAWPREQFDEVQRVPQLGIDGTPYAFVSYERKASP